MLTDQEIAELMESGLSAITASAWLALCDQAKAANRMPIIEATVRLHIEDLRKTAIALANIEIPGLDKCAIEFTTAADELEEALRGEAR